MDQNWEIGSDWIKLDQNGTNWDKIDPKEQGGSNWIRLVQIG